MPKPFTPAPGIHVVTLSNPAGRPITVIVQCHQLAPHDVVGRLEIHSIAELQKLLRQIKRQHDALIEDVRARVRPESCGTGGPVPRRPSLDEMDGD